MKWLVVYFAAMLPAIAQDDVVGSTDHPLIGRYDGSAIVAYQENDFEGVKIQTGQRNEDFRIYEGRLTRVHYRMPEGVSVAAAYKNFETRLLELGFEKVYNCINDTNSRNECGTNVNWMDNFPIDHRHLHVDAFNYRVLSTKLTKDGAILHAQILVSFDQTTRLLLTVVEEQALEHNMIDAATIQKEVIEGGRIAIYDIYFDTDRADIKPESDPSMEQIALFLKASPSLEVIVVGHTDNQGTLDYNMELSQRRANSVRAELVNKYAIQAERISHAGVGFLSPVASNTSDGGRALNRRVEIVAR